MLKREFLAASKVENDELLVKRNKTQEEKDQDVKNMVDYFKKKNPEMNKFWTKNDEDMKKDDIFLRDYFMKRKWINKEDLENEFEEEDEEDEDYMH